MLWKNLFVFDSTQLGYVGSSSIKHGGYFAEQNHAFYPMFPWMANKLGKMMGDEHLVAAGLMLGLVQSYLNMLLLYRVGLLVYKEQKVAELAAYLYIASFSVLY